MSNTFFKNYQISDKIIHIEDPLGAFVTLLLGREKALLFDTTFGIGDLKSHVADITDLPLVVVNSHGHVDHSCGNYQFDEVFIHEADIPMAAQHNSRQSRQSTVDQAKDKGLLPENFEVEAYLQQSAGNLKPVAEGYCFDLGGVRLETVHVPGHTPGSMGLLDRENRVFLAGDAANPFVWLFLPESLKISDYLKTLNKMEGLDFDSFIISHAPAPLPKSRIGQFIHCASNIDVAKSRIFDIPFLPDVKPLVYAEGGKDFNDPDFCAVVYSPEKLG
ncbi:MAG: MBL fold metallo-hydrolase [Clostridiales bacterium]|jgi:glyoxylase-like metal-dependent hydrolase (beta-lactamase superfamily II)|nr:MBL fold metallo-hydrolase [Eubacteriales bacterium]MDH7566446.1 MBL fold metallo-hydrolase [Clostridiales bacterium]